MKFLLLLIFSLVGSISTSAQNILFHLPFNGNPTDQSTNGLQGNIQGATLTSDRFGQPNAAYFFDGIDDFYGFGVDLGRITFYTNNTEKMTIKDNGNVGIGTTNPSKKLEVDEGNILVKGINSFQTTGDAGTLFLGSVHHYIKGEYGFGVKIGTYIVGDAISIREGSGAVGIGTTNPTAKLDVNGNVKVGSNGIRISEIYELTGTTGTGISTLVTLPSGYDGSNTRVLSIEFESATSGGIWVGGVKNEPGGLEYILAANYVSINHPNTIKYQNAKFRMMLMKVE